MKLLFHKVQLFFSRPGSYTFGIVTAVAAVQLRILVNPLLEDKLTYVLFFPAIMASALFGGIGPAVLCTLICSLGAAHFLLEPIASLRLSDPTDYVGLGAFWMVALLATAISESQRWTRTRLLRLTDELVQARDEAVAADAAKSRFLAVMSHELRTPLNAVIGYAELIQEEYSGRGEDQMLRDLEKIRSSSHHLLTLLNDLLDMAKVESGNLDLHLEDVDVDEALEECYRLMAPLLDNKPVVLNVQKCACTVRADRVRLRQILQNLLFNAMKFTQEGSVSLSCRATAEPGGVRWAEFRITDTGPGIAAEDLPRLFQPFGQLDSSSTRIHGGTGLGLVISKRFCEAMGGTIGVRSTRGEGSTFWFRLPLAISTSGATSGQACG